MLADIPLGSWDTVQISAYLVWAALLYVGNGTWLTFNVSRARDIVVQNEDNRF
jgi:ABC-type uncharacterized transport system fused permease/ATPase subunit